MRAVGNLLFAGIRAPNGFYSVNFSADRFGGGFRCRTETESKKGCFRRAEAT